MKKSLCLFILVSFFTSTLQSQTATFITLDDAGNLYRVSVSGSGCSNTPLNLCNNIIGNPLSIALDGNKLYIVDNKGNLYKNTLTSTGTVGNCTKIGTFPTTTSPINGLTVGNGGIVYAAVDSKIETYNPTTNTFATLGSMPSQWTIGGDMLFYKGILYEAVKINGSATNCALIQINLSNVANSTLYMNFNAGTNAFGFASVTVPCSNNQAYALSNGTSTTKIYAIDMAAKTEATTATCTLNYNVYDAASIAETQSATPPTAPNITLPTINYCVGQTVNPLNVSVSVPDTLRWYKQATGGTSYGTPTPAVSSATVGSTNYYVSNFDTSTGCESDRSLITVIINPYPNTPTINPTGSNTICFGDSLKLTSSAATGNQWLLNGSPISSETNATYYAKTNGNYTVTATGVGGCSKTSVATTVNVTNAAISYVGSPFCNTGTATVTQTGDAGGTYSSTTGLSIDANTGTINLAASALGTYIITYTVGAANCKFTTSVQIVHPTALISYSATQYCKANAVQNVVLASGSTTGGTYSATPTGLTIDATTGTITPSTSQINNYIVTYSFGTVGVGCGVQTTTANVAIVDKTTSTTNKTICLGDSILFNGSYYNTAGTFTKTLTNAAGCDSIATLVLSIEDFKITLSATPNPVNATTNLLAQITATATIASSVWQPASLFTNNISTQNINAPNTDFTIKVNATSANGCIDSASKLITVIIENENVYIPNAFVPLNAKNAENLTFKVYGNFIKNATLDMYNQWGEKIKHIPNATTTGWDGTVRGKQQAVGVYTYIATITLQNNKVIYKKGSVNLLR